MILLARLCVYGIDLSHPLHRNVKLSPSGWPMRRRAVHLEDYRFLSPLHFPWSRATGFSAVQLSA